VVYTDGSSLPNHSCGAACIIQKDLEPPTTLHVLPNVQPPPQPLQPPPQPQAAHLYLQWHK
jgi:hypothetical protein